MGLFDAIVGANTTAATDRATGDAIAGIFKTQQANANQFRQSAANATGDVTTGSNNAAGALSSYFGNGQNALIGYDDKAQGQLDANINRAAATSLGGNVAFSPYSTTGGAASGALSNALGLNGAAGNAAATAAFQAAPGYQYTFNQATDAATRAAAATGMGASGNTLDAVAKVGANLANQGYQQYLTNLGALGSQGLTAASGMSSNNNAAASQIGTGATTGANLAQNTGTNIGTLDQALGLAQGNLANTTGINLGNIQTGLGAALTNDATNAATLGANLSIKDANAQDSATNTNNGIFSNLLKNVAGGFLSGGFGGVGGLAKGLF